MTFEVLVFFLKKGSPSLVYTVVNVQTSYEAGKGHKHQIMKLVWIVSERWLHYWAQKRKEVLVWNGGLLLISNLIHRLWWVLFLACITAWHQHRRQRSIKAQIILFSIQKCKTKTFFHYFFFQFFFTSSRITSYDYDTCIILLTSNGSHIIIGPGDGWYNFFNDT